MSTAAAIGKARTCDGASSNGNVQGAKLLQPAQKPLCPFVYENEASASSSALTDIAEMHRVADLIDAGIMPRMRDATRLRAVADRMRRGIEAEIAAVEDRLCAPLTEAEGRHRFWRA